MNSKQNQTGLSEHAVYPNCLLFDHMPIHKPFAEAASLFRNRNCPSPDSARAKNANLMLTHYKINVDNSLDPEKAKQNKLSFVA